MSKFAWLMMVQVKTRDFPIFPELNRQSYMSYVHHASRITQLVTVWQTPKQNLILCHVTYDAPVTITHTIAFGNLRNSRSFLQSFILSFSRIAVWGLRVYTVVCCLPNSTSRKTIPMIQRCCIRWVHPRQFFVRLKTIVFLQQLL
jgi:hypothetical protein